jgi:type II secretory ATPase GspE/PulE/Tfp pilus assembly ATPase PilB-like protein
MQVSEMQEVISLAHSMAVVSSDMMTLSTALPFNAVKFILLLTWIYLCLFFVQKVQYSPFISKQYRTPAMIITLFTGPLFLGTIIVAAAVKQSIQTGANFIEILKDYTGTLISGIQKLGVLSSKKASTVKLLDSSGRSIDELYGHGSKKRTDSRILARTEKLIADALDRRATDILIDPKDESIYTIRFRIDGVLRTVAEEDSETCKAVVNSIKAVSSMDISEKRRPQDGAFIAKKEDHTASFRVASAGVVNGEKLSIRVLNQEASHYQLDDTGIGKKQLTMIREVINKPSGMILVCGPTGSGKTTTLYAMLNEMDRFTRNVITVEDPIEAVLSEASQIEINPKADITFSKALRSILRQDPDVICVGEIRDEETAEIGLRAAQTGHLVLATIHCDSNAAAIIRLVDLGISPLLIASGLKLLISQRLLRCLCNKCKEKATLPQEHMRDLMKKGIDPTHIYTAVGCKYCEETGYYNRTAICDLTVINDNIKHQIVKNKTIIDELRSQGGQKGRSNLKKQGLKKVVTGVTTFEELKRVIG